MRRPSRSRSDMPLITIRSATALDVPGIGVCNRQTLPENYTARFLRGYVNRWPSLTLVAVDRYQAVVAYTLARVGDVHDETYAPANFGFLTSIAVLPEFQKCGLGSKLIGALHDRMRLPPGLQQVHLHCRESNASAVKFYLSLGYVIDEVLYEYYADGGTALLMKKNLYDGDLKLRPAVGVGSAER